MNTTNRLKETILSEEGLLSHYKLIGFFGSSQEKKYFDDTDLVTIGDSNKHKELQKIIKNKFSKLGYKLIFFETIKKKPQKEENSILIHDLHYSSFENLYEKEWPDLINELKDSLVVIWGSSDKIHKVNVKEKDFYCIWLNWIKEVKSEKDYENFKSYILKILPKLYEKHKDLKLKSVGEKLILFLRKEEWKKEKREIESLLDVALNYA